MNINPYLYRTLMSMLHRKVVVQTTRGSVRGILTYVMPDHVVIHMGGSYFFIRTQQIVWFVPARN